MREAFGLISIIMAAYNAEKTIAQAINSVLHQTYRNFELLVVNDCSTDGTEKLVERIAAKDHRVRLVSNTKNSGVSFTRKHGLEEAKGDWIAILDSDDAWAPEKLEKQIALQEKTNADLLFTGSAFMDADGKPINWYLTAPTEITYRQLLKQNILSNSSALVRKELYAKHYAVGDGMRRRSTRWRSATGTAPAPNRASRRRWSGSARRQKTGLPRRSTRWASTAGPVMAWRKT